MDLDTNVTPGTWWIFIIKAPI